jgi:hypothetical protein
MCTSCSHDVCGGGGTVVVVVVLVEVVVVVDVEVVLLSGEVVGPDEVGATVDEPTTVEPGNVVVVAPGSADSIRSLHAASPIVANPAAMIDAMRVMPAPSP